MIKQKIKIKIFPMHYDLTFKNLFGTTRNINYLKKLLMELLDTTKYNLEGMKIRNSVELIPEVIYGKRFIPDIIIELRDGTIINLEIYTKFNTNERIKSVMYVAKIFSSELEAGKEYKKVKNLEQINIVKGIKGKKFKEDYYMINSDDVKDNLIPKDLLKVSVVHLDNIPKTSYNNHRWCRLLGATTYEEMKEIAKGDKLMEEAVEENRRFSQRKDVQEYFENRDILQELYIGKAHEDGLQEGKIKGKLEGKLEGTQETKLEIVKNMLQDNVPKEVISKYIGLTIEEIDKLSNS